MEQKIIENTIKMSNLSTVYILKILYLNNNIKKNIS